MEESLWKADRTVVDALNPFPVIQLRCHEDELSWSHIALAPIGGSELHGKSIQRSVRFQT